MQKFLSPSISSSVQGAAFCSLVLITQIMFPGEDTPDQKRPLASSTEDQSLHRVFGSERMVMKGCSGVIERNREKMYKFIDEIVENASSVEEMGLISEKLRVLEVKETESDLRRVNEEALLSRIQDQENKLALIYQSVTKTFDALKTEFKEEAHQLRNSIHDKLCALEKAEIDFDLKQRVETERLKLESKRLEAKKNELTLLEEAIREKSAELKRKEEAFELKQKQETEKQRGQTENNEEKMKELELKQVELEEGLQQQLINAETPKRRSNVEFEPLTRLAKRHKFQEADKSLGDPKRLICPRKGETWALFRDWDTTWNTQPDLHESPYQYDFVEVISELDDHQGIAVELLSMELISAQHGIMEIVIPPEEMQRFSHKVSGCIGEEKEDRGNAITAQDQDGSTIDMAIILD